MDENEYYLDLDFLSDFCAIKIEKQEENDSGEVDENGEPIKINTMSSGIDVFKYDIIKMCLDRILFDKEMNSMDSELMTMRRSSEEEASYKLAFNTLLAHKIIKRYEREY